MEEYIRVDLEKEWLNKGRVPELVEKVRRENPAYEFLAFNGNDAVMRLKIKQVGTKGEEYPEHVMSPFLTTDISDGTMAPKLGILSRYAIKTADSFTTGNSEGLLTDEFMEQKRSMDRSIRIAEALEELSTGHKRRKEIDELAGLNAAIKDTKFDVSTHDWPELSVRETPEVLKEWADNLSKMYPHVIDKHNILPDGWKVTAEHGSLTNEYQRTLQAAREVLKKQTEYSDAIKPEFDMKGFPPSLSLADVDLTKIDKATPPAFNHCTELKHASLDETSFQERMAKGRQHALDKWNGRPVDPAFWGPGNDTPVENNERRDDASVTVHEYAVSMHDAKGELCKKKTVIAASQREAIDMTRKDKWWYDEGSGHSHREIGYPVRFTASTSWSGDGGDAGPK